MISAPQIVETSAEEAAVIHLNIPRSEMMKQFGPAIGELLAELHTQGIEPVGGVFAHHLKMSPEMFDFELGIKVTAPVRDNGRVRRGGLPATKVARTVYSGPYEGLAEAWGEFSSWMDARGLKRTDDLWEVYSVGPQSSPDPTNWRTELNKPLRS